MNQQQKTTIICYKSTVPAPDAAVSSRQGDLLDEMKEGRRKTRSWKWKKKNVSHSWYPILDFFLPSASLSCRVSYYERPFRGNICYVCLPGVPSLFWKQHSSLCSSSGLYSYTPRRDSMPLDIIMVQDWAHDPNETTQNLPLDFLANGIWEDALLPLRMLSW